jgi:predicted  nucleic acid-binding Zn-ribbon protein
VSACGSCRMAERNPGTGHYHHGCPACDKRAFQNVAKRLAGTDGYAASMAAKRFRADYAASLRKFAGDDASERERLHQAVRAWDKRIRGEA